MPAAPFTVHVPDDVLDDLAARLARSRFPTRTAPGWRAGTDPDYLRELVAYWRDGFDWRARERELNAFPQYTAEIDGRLVHFVHLRAATEDAENAAPPLPLILTHGWPSSFVEMLPLARLLADPAAHGAPPRTRAFDVVIPSLPGFLFSEAPAPSAATADRTAATWAKLMTEVVGYDRFGAYGGDVGSHVTDYLAAGHPDAVAGMYTHHPCLHPAHPENPPLSDSEAAYLAARAAQPDDDSAYGAIQSTRPDTVAAALLDSPSGLAAWIVEKYRAWGDCDGDLETRFDKDLLLTVITLYWATASIGTSFRPYYDDEHTPPLPPVTVPAGITLTREDAGYPREFAQRTYRDLRTWRETDVGRHFLPLEEPALIARHLRDFFGGLGWHPTAHHP